jgi:hypothetical protein
VRAAEHIDDWIGGQQRIVEEDDNWGGEQQLGCLFVSVLGIIRHVLPAATAHVML